MPERPLVSVQLCIPHDEDEEAPYEVLCSACGPVEDPSPLPRHELQRLAYRHAWDVHDGDVDQEGWA
ncbi:MAG: hypothetical protein AB7O29_12800 [Acidimicrobiia bacterium]